MTRELIFEQKKEDEIIKELNQTLGNSPYKVIEETDGFRVLVPENDDDPLDLFSEEIDALDDIVEPYLKSINVEGELGFDILGQTIWVNIDGEDAGYFLKNRGDLLNDLQYMLEVFLNKKFPKVKLYVKCDAEARRRGHIDSMRDLAKKKAQLVLESGETQKLPPMNAYERRVIHLDFLPDSRINTRSHGMGSLKQVIISAAKEEPAIASSEEPQS